MIVIYNPRKFNKMPGAPINDIFLYKRYQLGINEMAQFDDQVGMYLLKKYGFLRKVNPEEISKVKKEIESPLFTCEFCDADFDSEQKLHAHMIGKHKLSKEAQEQLDGVPVAQPIEVVGRGRSTRSLSPDEAEGIPADGVKDRDGVQWVGDGLQEDTLTDMRPRVPGSTKGVFGAG